MMQKQKTPDPFITFNSISELGTRELYDALKGSSSDVQMYAWLHTKNTALSGSTPLQALAAGNVQALRDMVLGAHIDV